MIIKIKTVGNLYISFVGSSRICNENIVYFYKRINNIDCVKELPGRLCLRFENCYC